MVNKENYEEYMLLYADGELSDAEVKALLAFVDANPELRSELEAYNATRLLPDTKMVFENKEQLLKSSASGRTIALGKWWMYAAAACVIFFVVMIMRREDTIQPMVATNTETPQPTKTDSPVSTNKEMDNPKEFHSTPVKPISHENAIAKRKIPNAKSEILNTQKQESVIVKKEETKQSETQTYPVTQPKQEEPVIAKTEPIPHAINEQKQPVKEEPIALQNAKEERGKILERLPFNQEKTEGLTMIADAINEKIEKIKEVRNNLKDTDVKFRIGNKELFIVRL